MLNKLTGLSRRIYRKVVPESARQKIYGSILRERLVRLSEEAPIRYPEITRQPGAELMTMIVPCYNVSQYIDKFFESLITQLGSLNDAEVLCVDDGSTDSTPDILKFWSAQYPDLIRVITQPNGGLSAARNTGLREASGKWVSFPDPDDFLKEDFVLTVRKALQNRYAKPLLAVCCKLVFYYEDVDEISDSHPLTTRFSKPISNVTTDNMGDFIHLAANTCWMPRETLLKHDLTFDGHGWGSFEDAHMINRLFMLEPSRTVSFVEPAHYYYRKRKDGSSMVDTAKTKKSYWLDQMELGCLDLLEIGARLYGTPPKYVQRTVLYEMMWRVHYLARKPFALDSVLTKEEYAKSKLTCAKIMAKMEESTIQDFYLASSFQEHKVGLLALFKNTRIEKPFLYLESMDTVKGEVIFNYFVGGSDDISPTLYLNEKPVEHEILGARRVSLFDDTFYRCVTIRISMQDSDQLECHFGDKKALIKRVSKAVGSSVSLSDLVAAYTPPAPSSIEIFEETGTFRLRGLVTSQKAQEQYGGCWILMDSDTRADDNAEHLYRYLMANGAADSAYFVLEPSSRDWSRLEEEGFKLLPMRSDEHIMALYNSSLVVSSHADHYVHWPLGRWRYKDLAKFKTVFLQHGVIKDDLSRWLNSKKLNAFLTSTTDEYNSIVSPESRYAFSSHNVFLTGLPRHDALLQKSQDSAKDSIVIMPTWRRDLTDETGRVGNERKRIETFAQSEFAQNWKAVLHSEELRKSAEEKGLRVLFAPHPNAAMYIDEFETPDWVEDVDVRGGLDYQAVLSKCALLITDYSSIAFEAAYIDRPVIYFQFDRKKFFDGNHVYDKGYFSYEDDGLGPIAETVDDLIATASDVVLNGPNEEYSKRQKRTFKYRDGKCSERVYQLMKSLTTT